MPYSPFTEMQKAVDIVGMSRHPTNKIAATIFGTDSNKRPFSISKTNFWPGAIRDQLGATTQVGSSSGTVHAETACILNAPYSDGASLCITDPFCPNCAKNMAEAGIRKVYIDHKGFDKDFAARRGEQFDRMSMRICERAGISVYEIRRKEELLVPILEVPAHYKPYEEFPVEIEPVRHADEANFRSLIEITREKHHGRAVAVALARDPSGRVMGLSARSQPAVGYSSDNDIEELDRPEGKYSFRQEPVNRILMNMPRFGMTLVPGLLFSSRVPTSREQVNIVGAGVTSIIIGNFKKSRDDASYDAMKLLADHEILNYYAF